MERKHIYSGFWILSLLCSTLAQVAPCSQQTCQNGSCRWTNVGFACSCNLGFENPPGDYSTCVDTNECLVQSICPNGECINYAGTYECRCHHGYKQASNRKGCTYDPSVPFSNTWAFSSFLDSIGYTDPGRYVYDNSESITNYTPTLPGTQPEQTVTGPLYQSPSVQMPNQDLLQSPVQFQQPVNSNLQNTIPPQSQIPTQYMSNPVQAPIQTPSLPNQFDLNQVQPPYLLNSNQYLPFQPQPMPNQYDQNVVQVPPSSPIYDQNQIQPPFQPQQVPTQFSVSPVQPPYQPQQNTNQYDQNFMGPQGPNQYMGGPSGPYPDPYALDRFVSPAQNQYNQNAGQPLSDPGYSVLPPTIPSFQAPQAPTNPATTTTTTTMMPLVETEAPEPIDIYYGPQTQTPPVSAQSQSSSSNTEASGSSPPKATFLEQPTLVSSGQSSFQASSGGQMSQPSSNTQFGNPTISNPNPSSQYNVGPSTYQQPNPVLQYAQNPSSFPQGYQTPYSFAQSNMQQQGSNTWLPFGMFNQPSTHYVSQNDAHIPTYLPQSYNPQNYYNQFLQQPYDPYQQDVINNAAGNIDAGLLDRTTSSGNPSWSQGETTVRTDTAAASKATGYESSTSSPRIQTQSITTVPVPVTTVMPNIPTSPNVSKTPPKAPSEVTKGGVDNSVSLTGSVDSTTVSSAQTGTNYGSSHGVGQTSETASTTTNQPLQISNVTKQAPISAVMSTTPSNDMGPIGETWVKQIGQNLQIGVGFDLSKFDATTVKVQPSTEASTTTSTATTTKITTMTTTNTPRAAPSETVTTATTSTTTTTTTKTVASNNTATNSETLTSTTANTSTVAAKTTPATTLSVEVTEYYNQVPEVIYPGDQKQNLPSPGYNQFEKNAFPGSEYDKINQYNNPSQFISDIPNDVSNQYSTSQKMFGSPLSQYQSNVVPEQGTNSNSFPSNPMTDAQYQYAQSSQQTSQFQNLMDPVSQYQNPSRSVSQYPDPSNSVNQYPNPSGPANQYPDPSGPANQYPDPSVPAHLYPDPSGPANQYPNPSGPVNQYLNPSGPASQYPSAPPQYSKPSGPTGDQFQKPPASLETQYQKPWGFTADQYQNPSVQTGIQYQSHVKIGNQYHTPSGFPVSEYQNPNSPVLNEYTKPSYGSPSNNYQLYNPGQQVERGFSYPNVPNAQSSPSISLQYLAPGSQNQYQQSNNQVHNGQQTSYTTPDSRVWIDRPTFPIYNDLPPTHAVATFPRLYAYGNNPVYGRWKTQGSQVDTTPQGSSGSPLASDNVLMAFLMSEFL